MTCRILLFFKQNFSESSVIGVHTIGEKKMGYSRKKSKWVPHPWKFCKIVWLENSNVKIIKPRPMEILLVFYLEGSWKFHFFFDWPQQFPHAFFKTPGNVMGYYRKKHWGLRIWNFQQDKEISRISRLDQKKSCGISRGLGFMP